MNLGERITALRVEKRLSQDELAELLDVSRQSVSKWETNRSVPELDKLLRLSEVFGVTLDELVKGAAQSEDMNVESEAAPAAAPAAGRDPHLIQKIIGILLLCFGGLAALLLVLFAGDLLAALLSVLPLFFCGAICLKARHRAGLWCTWAVFLYAMLWLNSMTGFNWRTAFMPIAYERGVNIALVVDWVIVLLAAALVGWTLWSFRALRLPPDGRTKKVLLAGSVGWVAIAAAANGLSAYLIKMLLDQPGNYNYALGLLHSLTRGAFDGLLFAGLAILLVLGFGAYREEH